LLQIEEIGFIQKGQVAGEDALFTATRELINRIHLTVSNGVVPNPFIKPYGPFGFADTGALVVMHSNCPDNTVPIIHHSSDTWDPLFPRSSRI
jgi:hypothetical protein